MKWLFNYLPKSFGKRAKASNFQRSGSFALALKILEEEVKCLGYFDLRVKYLCLEGLKEFDSAFATISEMAQKYSLIFREDYEAYLRLSSRIHPSTQFFTSHPINAALKFEFQKRLIVYTDKLLESDMLTSKRSLGKSSLYKSPPVYLGELKPELPGSIIESRDANLIHFKEVLIFSESNWVLGDKYAFHDYVSDDLRGSYVFAEKDKPCVARFSSNEALFEINKYGSVHFDVAIWLGGWGSSEFGHFFQSIAPKVAMLDSIDELKGIPLIIDEGMPENYKQVISQLTNRKVEPLKGMTRASVKRLIYITDRVFCPVHLNSTELEDSVCPVDPGSLFSIQEKLGASNSIGSEYIYLTRRSSQWRKLQNEAELEKALIKLGFRVVDLFRMTQSQIRECFENAAIVVSPLSSGILNVIFSAPGTKLIVILGNVFNEEYLAGAMEKLRIDLEFYKAIPVAENRHRHSHININVTDFAQKIGTILRKPSSL